ncbi:hypothetical protein, partial [Mycobacterium sp.]|uniref:hypothetical protein n=1 Tax=Mycobacterium sp. TaxID=1785 RepID=UPI0025D404D7
MINVVGFLKRIFTLLRAGHQSGAPAVATWRSSKNLAQALAACAALVLTGCGSHISYHPLPAMERSLGPAPTLLSH